MGRRGRIFPFFVIPHRWLVVLCLDVWQNGGVRFPAKLTLSTISVCTMAATRYIKSMPVIASYSRAGLFPFQRKLHDCSWNETVSPTSAVSFRVQLCDPESPFADHEIRSRLGGLTQSLHHVDQVVDQRRAPRLCVVAPHRRNDRNDNIIGVADQG